MYLHMHTWVSMGLWARAFQSGAEKNRRCGSRTVLTGSLGTIALTDPSDWVQTGIKTLSLPLSEFFLFPFSPLSCSPLCRSLSLSLTLPSLTLFFMSLLCVQSPLLLPHFIFPSTFFLFSPHSVTLCFECGEVLGLFCWSHLLVFTALSPSVIRETTVTLVCPSQLETLKCMSSILLFLKAKLWRSQM